MLHNSRQQRAMQVIRMPGAMTIHNALELRSKLTRLLGAPGIQDLALDLSNVENVDASGLGALMAAFTEGQRSGHKIYIYNPAKPVRDLFSSLDITGFFPFISNENDLFSRLHDQTDAGTV